MFYQPDLFVYLWLLPITLMVVVPAILSATQATMAIVRSETRTEKNIPESVAQYS